MSTAREHKCPKWRPYARVHRPWTRVSKNDTRVHGPCLWTRASFWTPMFTAHGHG